MGKTLTNKQWVKSTIQAEKERRKREGLPDVPEGQKEKERAFRLERGRA